MDPEIDDDEIEGEAYPSDQYIDKEKDCWISITIECGRGKRAIFISAECKKYSNIFCPIESLGVLRSK